MAFFLNIVMNITEKLAYKERLITRVKVILAQGKYPTELFEEIKDERLLKEVMKEMMPSAGIAYELLNDEEKRQRDRLSQPCFRKDLTAFLPSTPKPITAAFMKNYPLKYNYIVNIHFQPPVCFRLRRSIRCNI